MAVLERDSAGGAGRSVVRRRTGLPDWSTEFTDHDWHVVAGWQTHWSLTDVLADYDTCDLFARYLVEHGAGGGTYHAALFGYCYLNDVRYLDASTKQSRLAIQAMFDGACRLLEADFERFATEMARALRTLVARQPVVVSLEAAAVRWHGQLEHAEELRRMLLSVGSSEDLDAGLDRAFQARGPQSTVARNELGSVVVAYQPPAFQLTVAVEAAGVAAHNSAVLERLRHDQDACGYLQLDGLVVAHPMDERGDPVLQVLRACYTRRYGRPPSGLIERRGTRERPEGFVVHSPAGPDPAAVSAAVAAHYPDTAVVVDPF